MKHGLPIIYVVFNKHNVHWITKNPHLVINEDLKSLSRSFYFW